MKLEGSNFIVTGGASGLGEATVRALHGGGSGVLICDLDNERGEALAAELGDAAVFLSTDVASEADGHAAIDRALERFGSLNGLVNCAGTITTGGIEDCALSDWISVINANLNGAFMITQSVLPLLKNAKEASMARDTPADPLL